MAIIAPISAVVRPTDKIRRQLGILHGAGAASSMQAMLDDLVGVDALSRLLTEGIEKVTAKDGRLDTKDLAAFVLRAMKKDG